jgi:hypothetical protein
MHKQSSGRDDAAPVAKRSTAYLAPPQALGLLPTWSFWNRRDVWKSGKFFGANAGAGLVLLSSVAVIAGAPIWVAASGAGAAYIVGLGLFERLSAGRHESA